MPYAEHPPLPPLRRHVACYWTRTADPRDGPPHRVLPDGCLDLLFERGGGSARVIGVMTRPVLVPPRPSVELVGVRFRPGEAFAFLGVAAHETRDVHVTLEEVWGDAAQALADRIARAPTLVAALRAVDAVLLERLLRARPADPRVRAAVSRLSSGAPRVAAVAREVGLGERQLERAFLERVGLGPKGFARVMRLQALVDRARAAPRAKWSALAAELGYADQAHLVRDVRALAGVTPGELVPRRDQAAAAATDDDDVGFVQDDPAATG